MSRHKGNAMKKNGAFNLEQNAQGNDREMRRATEQFPGER